ncbi:TRAP transporter large permease [Alkaliphilus peptidifermentans]|uniref:TRAP transporter, DctM subunit n=1 Tax=Alkaliphilus peptidifermentans DSM 18978 TaxID=1120976 RepID=A0A1G5L6H7_9FIRM|nr:TRAP transporter large permease [Alkaliphilus peptidifermentans]SCZ07948.1 TRAP transporter, DctM subunit [Alkaliphilus peptidifermentans DSM 18978]
MGLVVVVFFIFLLLGMPVAFAIGISGTVFFATTPGLPYTIVVQNVVRSTQSFTLLAIPLFIFAGNLMNNTGLTTRLIKLANSLTGHMYGNLAQVSCVLSTMMGGVSGSANADAAMQCRVLGPSMTKRGYRKGYSAAVNGVTSLITATIPPSMGLIIYGSVGEVSIGRLFAAGIVPGIMMMIALMITIRYTAKKNGYMPESKEKPSLGDVGKAFLESIWALMFPIILLFGIRMGILTPSESGAFAAVYAIFVGVFIYKELTWERFKLTLKDSIRDIGIIMILVALSGIFGYGIVYDRIPQQMAEILTGITSDPIMLMFIVVSMLVFSGMFVETTVVTLLLTPILLPVVTRVGIDPVQFGVVMMSIVTMGIITPPVGIALYTTSNIMGCKPQETAKESIPFIIAILGVITLCILFPNLVLFIPNMIFGK